jgi:hypothetical protein
MKSFNSSLRTAAVFTGLLMVAVALVLFGLRTQRQTTSVSIAFEGPWAFVPDPQDQESVLAIAPKTKSHYPLTVGDSNGTPLDAGVYTLDIPGHGPSAPPKLDQTFLRTRVPPENVTHALGARLERYAIRLPRPERYVAMNRQASRIGNEPERNYVSEVSLVYIVKDFSGLSLAGTSDSEATSQTLQLPAHSVHFRIAPVPDPSDVCDAHVREAFHDLTKLLGLAQTMSMPSPGNCQMKMP